MNKIKPRGADWEMLLENGYEFLDGDGGDAIKSKIGKIEVMGTKPDFWARQGYAPPGERILTPPVIILDGNYTIAEWTAQAIRLTKYPRSYDKPADTVVIGEKLEKMVQSQAWERIETYLSDALLGETTYDVEVPLLDPVRKIVHNVLFDVRPSKDASGTVMAIELADPEPMVSRYLQVPVVGSVTVEMQAAAEEMETARKKLAAGMMARMTGKSDGGPKSYKAATFYRSRAPHDSLPITCSSCLTTDHVLLMTHYRSRAPHDSLTITCYS